MKQIMCGTAILGVFVLAGCYSYASKDINDTTYDKVQANPLFATMNVGDSDELILRLVNDANNGTLTSYTITGVPAGIAVHPIPNYRDLFTSDTLNPTGDKTAQAYYIVGATPGRYTFIATPTSVNTGISASITVLVQPNSLGASLSEHSGIAGDTVTIHANTGITFTSTSKVSFPTGNFAQIGVSPDSTSIKIIAGPGLTGPATVTNVGQTSAPTVKVLTLVTSDSLVTPALTTAPTTVSNAAPDIGVPITVTLGNNLRFIANSHVFVGGNEAGINSVSADSSTATIVPMAGSSGTVTYTNIALSFLNSVPLALTGDKSIAVTNTFTGAPDPNVTARATAPTLTLRPTGATVVTGGPVPSTNAGQCAGETGDGCAIYKVVLAASTTYDINLIWQGGSDMGLYRLTSTGTGPVSGGTGFTGNCDTGGQAPGNEPETCTVTSLAAGTYFFTVQFFGTGSGYPPSANTVPPTWYQFRVVLH
jgi:hypothetical protein